MTNQDDRSRITAVLNRLEAWMRDHGAAAIFDNLADGLSPEQLAAFEGRIGFACPKDLRDLWSIHGGQRDDGKAFVGALNLLSPDQAMGEREHILMSLEFMREDPDSYEEAGVTDSEAASDEWISIAAQGYADQLIVNARSGRVFTCEKDAPPVHFVAESIIEFLENYATRLENGHYDIEEGFGGIYLSSSDNMY